MQDFEDFAKNNWIANIKGLISDVLAFLRWIIRIIVKESQS